MPALIFALLLLTVRAAPPPHRQSWPSPLPRSPPPSRRFTHARGPKPHPHSGAPAPPAPRVGTAPLSAPAPLPPSAPTRFSRFSQAAAVSLAAHRQEARGQEGRPEEAGGQEGRPEEGRGQEARGQEEVSDLPAASCSVQPTWRRGALVWRSLLLLRRGRGEAGYQERGGQRPCFKDRTVAACLLVTRRREIGFSVCRVRRVCQRRRVCL